VPLALSPAQELGLGLAALAFVVFALVSSMLIPRYRPDFPGRHVGWFVAVAALFTVGMLLTVAFVAKETGEAEHAAAEETHPTQTEPPVTEEPPPTTETEPAETEPAETETETTETETTETETAPTETADAAGGDTVAGKAIFLEAGCTGCHTLADAGATGTLGPNLDEASPSADKVVERVTDGKGAMPSFAGSYTAQEIQDVAAYVSSVAGS
jgi:cytochrome c551/c552